jgi:hypothetical protein
MKLVIVRRGVRFEFEEVTPVEALAMLRYLDEHGQEQVIVKPRRRKTSKTPTREPVRTSIHGTSISGPYMGGQKPGSSK